MGKALEPENLTSCTHNADAQHPRRVLHVVTDSFSATTAVAPLALYLADRGWQNMILCSGKSYEDAHPFVDQLRAIGVDAREVEIARSIRPITDLRRVAQVWMLIRREKPSLVHTHFAKGGIVGRVGAWLGGVPCIHTVYDYAFVEQSGARRWVYRMIERRAAGLARRILFISDHERQIGVTERVGDPARMITVGCGVDLRVFNPRNVPKRQVSKVRQSLAIPQQRLIVGVVARLVARKGIDVLLKAAARLSVEAFDWHLLIVGGGPLRRQLSDLTTELGISGRVSFTGFIDEVDMVPALLRAMDVFCLPSRREGYGLAYVEASAMGKPIVAPDMPPMNELVVDGVTGLLTRPEDPASVAAALHRLLSDSELRRVMGGRARQFVSANCDIRESLERTAAVYGEVLTGDRDTPDLVASRVREALC